MGGHPDYEFASYLLSIGGATGHDLRWLAPARFVSLLQNMAIAPWVTVGSSCAGYVGSSDIIAWSATPDGIDYWAGKNRQQATVTHDGSAYAVWHVLRNSVSGLEIMVMVNPTHGFDGTDGFILAVAQNGFTDGAGHWRGGGTGVDGLSDRPFDSSSSPASDRGVESRGNAVWLPQDGQGTVYVANRRDGRGFWAFATNAFDTGDETLLWGVHPIARPKRTQTNKYAVLVAKNAGMGTGLVDTSNGQNLNAIGGGTWRLRSADGTLVDNAAMSIDNRNGGVMFTTQLAADPWTSEYPLTPCMLVSGPALTSNANLVYEGTPADIYQAGSYANPGDSLNLNGVTGALIKLGPSNSNPGIAVPWDGSASGTPRAVYDIIADATVPPPAPTPPTPPGPPPPLASLPEVAPAVFEPDFGTDIDVLTDLPPGLTLVQGRRNLAQAIARRLITPEGFLRDVTGDEAGGDYGFDVRALLNSGQGVSDVANISRQVERQCTLEPRVAEASVDTKFDLSSSTITFDIDLETAEGPFDLVLQVSAVSVAVLNA